VLGAPFIGRGIERSGREAGGQAAASGAPSKLGLVEEEATRRPFDEGEMKRVDGATLLFPTWCWRSMGGGTRGTVAQATQRRQHRLHKEEGAEGGGPTGPN
jgi:hypothetical protein